MSKDRWRQIRQFVKNGDPLKDIDCDEGELFTYCEELRKEVNHLRRVVRKAKVAK